MKLKLPLSLQKVILDIVLTGLPTEDILDYNQNRPLQRTYAMMIDLKAAGKKPNEKADGKKKTVSVISAQGM
jgi:hypothetical protein